MVKGDFEWERYVFQDAQKERVLNDILSNSNAAIAQLIRKTCNISGVARLLSQLFSFSTVKDASIDHEYLKHAMTAALLEHYMMIPEELRDFLRTGAIDSAENRVEYSRLFVVPPIKVKLYGRDYQKRPRPPEGERASVLRFYHRVGMTLPVSRVEPADHLVCELEFIYYLTYYEMLAIAVNESNEADEWRRLRHEFMSKHAFDFMTKVSEKIILHSENDYYLCSAMLLASLTKALMR